MLRPVCGEEEDAAGRTSCHIRRRRAASRGDERDVATAPGSFRMFDLCTTMGGNRYPRNEHRKVTIVTRCEVCGNGDDGPLARARLGPTLALSLARWCKRSR